VKVYVKSVLQMSYKIFTSGPNGKMNHMAFRDAVRDALKDKKSMDSMDH
jgi:hypothetical protein